MSEKQTIAAIKAKLMTIHERNHPDLLLFAKDERAGVKQAVKQCIKRIEKEEQLLLKAQEMKKYERLAYAQGYKAIAGIDEVGRGPLAGPVVAAAVILPKDEVILGLNDSKQLSEKKREQLYDEIQEKALAIGIGVVDNQQIDQINIYQASKEAMKKALSQLAVEPDYLLIDAMSLEVPIAQEGIIKGDAKSASIAAASIVAKVYRDRLMQAYDQKYPGYGFAKNAGYGTKEHLAGLQTLGIIPIHRLTFAPIKDMI